MKASLTAVAAALAVSAAALGVHAQTITMTPELKKIVEAAKQEGALTVGMADEPMAGNRGTADGEKGMNKMFGTNIKVKYVVAPPYAQQGAALLTEMQAKQPSSTDIYVSTAVQFSPLAKQGLFLAEDWAKLYPARIKPEFVEGNNQAVRIYTSLPAVLYNKRFEKQVQKTDDLYDYLKPEWKGKFVTTPYLAGFDVLIAKENWGPKKMEEYVRALSQQVSGMLSCGSADRIASGEMPVLVVDCASAVQNTPKFKSILGMHILRDIAQRRYGYLSVPVNAVHPNAAKLYILYYSSPEGQAALYKNTGYDMSDYPDSRRAPVVKEMQAKGVKFKDVTVAWWESQPDVTENHRAMVKLLIQSAGKK
jgi:ABC-type Fe3+ transport system substrate-binding protein